MAQEQPMPENKEPKMDDIKRMLDQADAEMGEPAGDPKMAAEGADMAQEGAMEEQMGEAAMAEATEGIDLNPLMQTLGATEERAQQLYDAAQQIPNLAGKTPQELSDMIATDFDVLMQLEMVAARGEGGAMGAPAAEAPMPDMGGAMPAGEMMPPEGM
jgi:hypothetical protein